MTVAALVSHDGRLHLLDPACGDGALLDAMARQLSPAVRARAVLYGYETDGEALHAAQQRLAGAGVGQVRLVQKDFLRLDAADALPQFDAVIANPPYVRTQVLGAARARELAERFGLTGRVDLYQAFTKAMARALRPGGALGLLVSNRFLSVQSGATLRHLLRTEFELLALYDLGDTRLFSAAVLPGIVVARRQDAIGLSEASHPSADAGSLFDRVYRCPSEQVALAGPSYSTVLEALRVRQTCGVVHTTSGAFRIERGVLQATEDDEVWSLSTTESRRWLATLQRHQRFSFGEVAQVRVGIKTTADEVFLREDWTSLPPDQQPEEELLRPVLTHLEAGKWIGASDSPRRILYPYILQGHRHDVVDLDDHPRTKAYLESHRHRLSGRKYLTQAGRRWYEIWVAHRGADWAAPKVVFPDIAHQPRFFLDAGGHLVNGDCYWMTLRPGFDRDWLSLIVAVANSSLATRYYDLAFHNQLYSGRRRFMTQYVRRFPLPDPAAPVSREIVARAGRIVDQRSIPSEEEARMDELVWESFGLAAEFART